MKIRGCWACESEDDVQFFRHKDVFCIELCAKCRQLISSLITNGTEGTIALRYLVIGTLKSEKYM